MRHALVPALIALGIHVVAGCASPQPPEASCSGSECTADSTPTCSPLSRTCTHACTGSADCADLTTQTTCDALDSLCAAPCTGDSVGLYACRSGERVYCADDATLSCAICPGACGAGTFCDGTACQPRRASGEACTEDQQCTGSACTSAGRCSVAQGEACTDETCEGVCALGSAAGTSYCIRSRCPSDCAESTAGGWEWTCARYETYEACVPMESCIWEGGCSAFMDATCGQSCRSGGGCWTYCVPNVISTDV